MWQINKETQRGKDRATVKESEKMFSVHYENLALCGRGTETCIMYIAN